MLKPSLNSWKDQYDRMKRSYEKLSKLRYINTAEYDDDLIHFIQDCWHLKDWIKNDTKIKLNISSIIEGEVSTFKSLRIVGDLANASKHFERKDNKNNKRYKEGAYATSSSVNVHVSLSDQTPSFIERSHVISLDDGTEVLAENIIHEAVKDWDALLKKLGLLT